jgi:hypothetical protein
MPFFFHKTENKNKKVPKNKNKNKEEDKTFFSGNHAVKT